MKKEFRESIEKGKKEEKIEIAKNMLKKGMDISIISELTNLDVDTISTLK